MTSVAHVIGNGKSAGMYTPAKGLKIACNMPQAGIDNLYTTVMVDFKMMKAVHEGLDWFFVTSVSYLQIAC